MMKAILKVIGSPKEITTVAALTDRPYIYLDFVSKPGNLHKELWPVVEDCMMGASEWIKLSFIAPPQKMYMTSGIPSINCWGMICTLHINKDREALEGMLVAQYHRGFGKTMEQNIVTEFPKPDSAIHVLISTVAFGMGV